ncbi:hypothetical protein N0V88_008027 [Collariella sp. IMI 366227]|nr:hypothetical protein N0V88_008027 [Collariella sp. IMI 366227]
MASNFLAVTGPAELILLIVDACESARDALALTLTCRRLHQTGRDRAVVNLWNALRSKIPHLELALISTRMTELVAEAERRNQLPPIGLSPGNFSSNCQVPTIPEIEAAVTLSLLVEGLTYAFLQMTHSRPPGMPYDFDAHWSEQLPEEEDRMPEFYARVHKAIYRVFIAGATLAGAYNEPMFKAAAEPGMGLDANKRLRTLSEEQVQFLHQFAVCNMEAAPEEEEVIFAPFGCWLFANIMEDKEARDAMAKRFKEGYGTFNVEETSVLEYWTAEDFPTLRTRLPYVAEEDRRWYNLDGAVSCFGKSAALYFRWLRGFSGQPNWTRAGPVSHLALKFFEYFLRRYLGLRFISGAFHSLQDLNYDEFLRHLTIFSCDNVPGRENMGKVINLEEAGFLDGTKLLTALESQPVREFIRADIWRYRPEYEHWD